MKVNAILPQWAPRVKAYLLRRLYEADANGLRDEELLAQVGWALQARCQSFLEARQAEGGLAKCPVCATPIPHDRRSQAQLVCASCGWNCRLRDYLNTIANQQLSGGPEVVALFQQYADAFPLAQTYEQKMLLVDQLIHGFHHFLSSGRTRRPVAVNLLDGDLGFVVSFLDQLSAGPEGTPGLEETRAAWKENVHGTAHRRQKET